MLAFLAPNVRLGGTARMPASSNSVEFILRSIPSPSEAWVSVSKIAQDSAEQAVLDAVLTLLKPFNAIVFSCDGGENQIRATSEASQLFLRSLAECIASGTVVVGDWERTGIREERFGHQDMAQGVQLLYVLERLRLDHGRASKPIRLTRVVKALIKAEVDGEPRYLVQYDTKTQGYQLIGGHVRTSDASEEAAIRREVAEELRPNVFDFGGNTRVQLLRTIRASEVSRTLGAYSEYEITYFQLFADFSLQLQRNTIWVTASELLEGKAKDRTPIREAAIRELFKDVLVELARMALGLTRQMSPTLARIPLGWPRQMTPTLRKTVEPFDRNTGRIGFFLSILSLLVPAVTLSYKS